MYIYLYEHDVTKITLVSSKLIKLIYIALRVALEKKKNLKTKFNSVFRISSIGLVIQINFKHGFVPKRKQVL